MKQKLSSESGRLEEVSYVRSVCNEIQQTPGDLYLKSLFSQEFFSWVESQIKNDYPPDMFGWWRDSEASLTKQLKEARETIDRERIEVDKLLTEERAAAERKDAILERKCEYISTLENNREELKEQIGIWSADARKEHDRADRLQAEINRLKVYIFDLEHPVAQEIPD